MKITRADRSFGTDRIMVFGPQMAQLMFLQGRQYSEVKEAILELSDSETKFYHRFPPEDPIQRLREVEVSKEEW